MSAAHWRSPGVRRKIIEGVEPAWITNHKRHTYVRAAYLSVPPWMSRQELQECDWYRLAWTAATGIDQVLDHIVPLNGANVCGLTVPWNFAIVPRRVNAFKCDRHTPDQQEMLI